MISQTYNIVITRDPKVTEKLFYDKFNRTSFTERFGSLSEEEKIESLIVSPHRNNNFISFDIDFPQAQQQRYAVLKLVESNELLEYFMVSKTGLEEFVKLKAKIVKSLRGNGGLIDEARKVKPSFFISFGMGDDVSQWSGPYVVELIDANLTTTSDGVREVEFMFSPTVEGQFVFTNKVFNDANIAQGGSVFNSNISLEEKFIIKADKTYGLVTKSINRGSQQMGTTAKLIKRPGEDGATAGGYNYAVRDLIKTYLAERFNKTPGNVICLFDDDFQILDELSQDKDTKKFKDKALEYGIKVDIPTRPETRSLAGAAATIAAGQVKAETQIPTFKRTIRRIQDQIVKQDEQIRKIQINIYKTAFQILEKANKYQGSRSDLRFIPVQNDFFITPDGEEFNPPLPQGANAKKNRGLIFSFISDATNYNRVYEKDRVTALAVIRKLEKQKEELEKKVEVGLQDLQKTEDDMADASKNKDSIAKKAYKNNIDALQNVIYVRVEDKVTLSCGRSVAPADASDTDLNILYPLYKLIDGINRSGDNPEGDKPAKLKDNDFTILEENNQKILKLLKKYGLISTDDSSVIIFGREKIINSVIYPGPNERLDFDSKLAFWDLKTPYKILKAQDYTLALANEGNPIRLPTTPPFTLVEGDPSIAEVLSRVSSYKRDFLNEFKDLATALTSSFRERADFGRFQKQADLKISSMKSPLVFMNNTKNSNVLELSFDSSPYKAVLLNVGYQSGYALLDEALETSSLISDNTLFSPQLFELIQSISKQREDSNGSDKDFITSLTSPDSPSRKLVLKQLVNPDTSSIGLQDAASLLDFVILKSSINPTMSKECATGDVPAREVDVLKNIRKYIISVKLKTLPFFNATTVMGRDCYLFGLANNIIGSNNLRDIEAPAFYTGAYTIIGYKHKISYDGAHSEFDLVPNAFALETISTNSNVIELFKFTKEEIDEAILSDKQKREAAEKRAKDARERDFRFRRSGGMG